GQKAAFLDVRYRRSMLCDPSQEERTVQVRVSDMPKHREKGSGLYGSNRRLPHKSRLHTDQVVCRVPYRCNSPRELARTYMSLLWHSHSASATADAFPPAE